VTLKLSAVPDKLFWVSLIFCTVFVSYRYPLQLGTSDTSPTYSDTPANIQAAKFVAVLSLSILSSWWALNTPIKTKRLPLLVLIILLQCAVLAKALYAFDVRFIDQTFWPLAALVLGLGVREVNTKSLEVFMKFLLVFSLTSDAIEVLLFLVAGRLPAQGYPNSIVVRFGAWLDSPNDFACILFLLMGWALVRYRGFKRIAVEGALFVCLLLTQSFTAYAFFAASLLLLIARHAVRRPRSFLWMGAVLGIVSVATALLLPDLFSSLMESKTTSIAGHLRTPKDLLGNWERWVWVGAPVYDVYENWWISSLFNLGIPWVVLCLACMVWLLSLVVRAFTNATNTLDRAVFAGILALSSYCVIGSWSFPVLTFFPVNFLFYLFCFLVAFGKLETSERFIKSQAEAEA